MRPALAVLLLFAIPVALASLRRWPKLACTVAASAVLLPFVIRPDSPLLRAAAAIVTWMLLVKCLQYAAGHATPPSWIDSLLFLLIPAVMRWDRPRRSQGREAVRILFISVLQLLLAWLLMLVVLRLDRHNPVQLFTTAVGIYLSLAAVCNLASVPLKLRGVSHDDPFGNPMSVRTPAEFWGRCWNTWVSHILHRYVFLAAGGRRHPVLGTLLAFAASGVLHEYFIAAGTRSIGGWMLAFFLLQGLLVIATSRSRSFRAVARTRPSLATAITLATVLGTAALLVRGIDGVDPSYAWRRCCTSSSPGQ